MLNKFPNGGTLPMLQPVTFLTSFAFASSIFLNNVSFCSFSMSNSFAPDTTACINPSSVLQINAFVPCSSFVPLISAASLLVKTGLCSSISYSIFSLFKTSFILPRTTFTVSLTKSSLMCNSCNCFSLTSLGAFSINDSAALFLGNAMTSLIDSLPVIIATILSKPRAIPPWGGVPYLNASSKNPNLDSASCLLIPKTENIFDCTSLLWILMEPPPISVPFSTISYAFAFAFSGSLSSNGTSLSLGLVNG